MKKRRIFTMIVLLTMILLVCTGCSVKYPVPEVKEGKFNFSVTYEVDGTQETVSGVFVCEFVEVVFALDGSYIEWNSSIEDAELANRLEKNRGFLLLKTSDDGDIYLDFNLSAKYFMADPSFGNSNANTGEGTSCISPRLFIEYNETKGEELGEWWSEDVSVLESYGVKIISYEYDAPIENTYK